MTIPLDIIRTTGRAATPVTAEVLRPLEEADLVLLGEEKGSKPPPLQRLRERHHALARNLASGMSEENAAAICGYDRSRVSILKSDPAFKELLLFYRKEVDAQYVQLHEVLSGMAVDAAVVLRERLEDDPEAIGTKTLIEITKMAADRTGHGPSSKQEVQVNVNLASRLEEARKRIASRTIDVTPNES